MASGINSTDVDGNFPVAGQDNDSQGFRDNFTTIKNSLATAKTEISTLQTSTAKLNAENDFAGTVIKSASLIATTEELYPSINTTSSMNISFVNGHYQIIQVGADVTLTLADWPASEKVGKIRLQLTSDGSSRQITWAVANGGGLKYAADWPGTFTVSSDTNPLIVDFWTHDGGSVVFAQYHGLYT